MQTFSIQDVEVLEPESYRYLKLSFPVSSDFYGRITVYRLEVLGIKTGDDQITE